MNDVRYAYRPGFDVLNGLSLTIRPVNDWPSLVPRARENPPSGGCSPASTRRERLGDGG